MSKPIVDMTSDELAELVRSNTGQFDREHFRDIVREELDEITSSFPWVPAKEHYDDHRIFHRCQARMPVWESNHNFVSAVRTVIRRSAYTVVTIVTAGITGWLGKAIYVALKTSQ